MKLLIFSLCFWLGFSGIANALDSASVISVGDGDTITVNQLGEKIKVRLGCIDAPEIKQSPYGEASRNRLRSLLPIGTEVGLRVIDVDRYGRTVGEVFKGSLSINLVMVQKGQAVIYRQYFDGCKSDQGKFEQAESQAKQRRLGFWNQNNPVMPWDFRRGKKTSSNSTPPSNSSNGTGCDPAYPDLCLPLNSPDLDCKDISARRFRVLPPDPHRFDRDQDGIGCEGRN